MSKTKQRDPLAPIEFIVTFVLGLSGALLVITVLLSAIGPHVHLRLGVGNCVSIQNGSAASIGGPAYPPTSPGTKVTAKTLSVCATKADGGQWIWLRLTDVPGAMFAYSTLIFVWLLTRRARRIGFFTLPVSRGLQGLGWYILGMALLVELLAAIGGTQFVDSVLPGKGGGGTFSTTLPWATLIGGCGVVTFGRLMARAVGMQDELDTTI